MKFDHKTLFDLYREQTNLRFTPNQVAGIENLLDFVEHDPGLIDLRWVAYMLATVKHECAGTWQPIEERGPETYFQRYEPTTKTGRVLGNVEKGDGARYKGRGYVQLTGRANYRQFGRRLSIGLEQTPELALDPLVSYRIASLGMRQGLFTGKALEHYLHGPVTDYRNARRIINGVDRADAIAGYAAKMEVGLRHAQIS
ncbi:hypothetical protein [Hymenobacter crusticola]|uniref:Glycoside hydrolase family 19 catalytic domain-containing protein n=1 Tax=Hymenobacter crusticola TaxID=1770526 RepID=A0A243WBU8_9BACT|nr:hypothetical protein [Hymenobacter crusticola]OUJ73081.1 hypothetical protein BXP70_14670 [Hymenobacter crusticola]